MRRLLLVLLLLSIVPARTDAAISFVAASFVGGTAAGTVDPGEPAGTTSGDVMVFLCYTNDTAPTRPTGWTALTSGSKANATFPADILEWDVSYVVRGGSAPSTNCTFSGTQYREGYILTFRGVDNATPIDSQSASGASGDTSGHNPDPPSTTAVVANTMAVAIGATWAGSAAGGYGAPTGYTLRTDNSDGNGGMVATKALSGSGAEDPGAFSNVSSGGAEHMYWDGFTITLKPTGGAAPAVHRLLLLGIGNQPPKERVQ